MRSSVSLVILLTMCGAAPPVDSDRAAPPPSPPAEVANADGPSGTAGSGPEAYDAVGYASWHGEELTGNRTATGERFDPAAITAAHRTLPLDSIAEVTSLDTGRTILVRINDRGPMRRDREIDLSRGAADQLGTKGAVIAVRVRGTVASPADIAALRSGRPASPRLDAPPALLAALRRGLNHPPVAPVAPPPPSVVPAPRAKPVTAKAPIERETVAARGRYQVQVAAFSTEARARAVAKMLHGATARAGALWRVRLGPFVSLTEAKRARDGAARRGYGDATILTDP